MSEQIRDRKAIFAGKSTKGSAARKFLLLLQKDNLVQENPFRTMVLCSVIPFHAVEDTNSPVILDIQGY
jgi:hypothetical protein